MNRSCGAFLALIFVACFFASQFHPVGEPQNEYQKTSFRIENFYKRPADVRFIKRQVSQFYSPESIYQTVNVKPQSIIIESIESAVVTGLPWFRPGNLLATSERFQHKIITTFKQLKKRELLFDRTAFLPANNMQFQSDEPHAYIFIS